MHKKLILTVALATGLSLAGPALAVEAQFWFNLPGGVKATIGTQPVTVVQQPVYVPVEVFSQPPIVIQGVGKAYYFNGRYYVQPVRYTKPLDPTMKVKFRGPSGAFVPPGQAKKHKGGHGHDHGHKNK